MLIQPGVAEVYIKTMTSKHYLEWSKEEKDQLANEKMESMKKKSEELKKRYEEVEADKRNAEIFSKFAITSKKGVVGDGKSPSHHKSTGRGRLLQQLSQQPCPSPKIGDMPPPDPPFNFLADQLRDASSFPEDRHQGSRRHHSNYGGQDFKNVKHNIQQKKRFDKEHPQDPPKNDMEMSLVMTGKERQEYAKWKAERAQIDNERVIRQKTSGGQWRREWDLDKVIQEEDCEDRAPQYYRDVPWGSRAGPQRGRNLKDRHNSFKERTHLTGDNGATGDFSNRSVVICEDNVTISINCEQSDAEVSNINKKLAERMEGSDFNNRDRHFKEGNEKNYSTLQMNRIEYNKVQSEREYKGMFDSKNHQKFQNPGNDIKREWSDDHKAKYKAVHGNNFKNKSGWDENNIEYESEDYGQDQKEIYKEYRTEKHGYSSFKDKQFQSTRPRNSSNESFIQSDKVENAGHYNRYHHKDLPFEGNMKITDDTSLADSKHKSRHVENRCKNLREYKNEDSEWNNFRRANKEGYDKYHLRKMGQNEEDCEQWVQKNKGQWGFKETADVAQVPQEFTSERYVNFESRDLQRGRNYQSLGHEKAQRVNSGYNRKQRENSELYQYKNDQHTRENNANFGGRNGNYKTNVSRNIDRNIKDEGSRSVKNEMSNHGKKINNLESSKSAKKDLTSEWRNQKLTGGWGGRPEREKNLSGWNDGAPIRNNSKKSTDGWADLPVTGAEEKSNDGWEATPVTRTEKKSHDGWSDKPATRIEKKSDNWEGVPVSRAAKKAHDGWEGVPVSRVEKKTGDGWEDVPVSKTEKTACGGWEDVPVARAEKEECGGWEDVPVVRAEKKAHDGLSDEVVANIDKTSPDGWEEAALRISNEKNTINRGRDDASVVVNVAQNKNLNECNEKMPETITSDETHDEQSTCQGTMQRYMAEKETDKELNLSDVKNELPSEWEEKDDNKNSTENLEITNGKSELNINTSSLDSENKHSFVSEELDDTVDECDCTGDDDSWEDVTTSGGESLSGQHEDNLYNDVNLNSFAGVLEDDTEKINSDLQYFSLSNLVIECPNTKPTELPPVGDDTDACTVECNNNLAEVQPPSTGISEGNV